MMHNSGIAREHRATFICLTTYSDSTVEAKALNFGQMFGTLSGDFHTNLGHDLHGKRVKHLGLGAGGKSFYSTRMQMPCPTFRHLTATGITSTEEKNSQP